MSNIKTYTRVGTAVRTSDNVTSLKVANTTDREAQMVDHTDIKFIDLPYPMDKYHAAMYAQTLFASAWTAEQLAAIKIGGAKALEKYYK